MFFTSVLFDENLARREGGVNLEMALQRRWLFRMHLLSAKCLYNSEMRGLTTELCNKIDRFQRNILREILMICLYLMNIKTHINYVYRSTKWNIDFEQRPTNSKPNGLSINYKINIFSANFYPEGWWKRTDPGRV